MTIRILGDPPLARNAEGKLISRIGTLFPRSRTLVTLPGIHATQRAAYIHDLNASRQAIRLPPYSEEEEMIEWQQCVDLIMENDTILIRPDPTNMPLAFEADELLQELVSKQKIKFLNVLNNHVRLAIKERGENWRIAPMPQSPEDMKRMISASMIPIGGRSIYYYARDIGTRFLTYQQFCELGNLPDDELKAHLIEIRNFSARFNRIGHPEIAFFATHKAFGHTSFPSCDPDPALPGGVRACFEHIQSDFRAAVRGELLEDNIENPDWRNLMYSCLIGLKEAAQPEEIMLGMSSEFFMQVEWLPGGRIEEGELIFDSIFEELDRPNRPAELIALCDEKAQGFIFNFMRELGDIEYINIGRVIGSLSRRPNSAGRRDVYVAEIKQHTSTKPIVRIIRMQKWGIREHLDEGKDLLSAILEAEEYTEYILDRRLGCRQLGMNIAPRTASRKINEHYNGHLIWATYFERDYVSGIATDKLPRSRFQNPAYSLRFAQLMGNAAAPNIVVGRMNLNNAVLFDDGDEVIIEDESGVPQELIVSDHTGTFTNYTSELSDFAEAYSIPIRRRRSYFPNPDAVIDAYLTAFTQRLQHLQLDYRRRKRAFDTLFKQRPRDERGSFAYRWERILDRLNRTDPLTLAQAMRDHMRRI